jgi:hypothetical protein
MYVQCSMTNNAIGSREKNRCTPPHHNNQHPHKMSASAASSSAASIAAAINDSKDDGREQVSDVVHDRTNDDDDVVSDDDVSDNKDKEMDEDVFFWVAREIMNRSNKKNWDSRHGGTPIPQLLWRAE